MRGESKVTFIHCLKSYQMVSGGHRHRRLTLGGRCDGMITMRQGQIQHTTIAWPGGPSGFAHQQGGPPASCGIALARRTPNRGDCFWVLLLDRNS
jgi:hypothetical protein